MKKLKFRRQVFSGFIVSIVLIVSTAIFCYERFNDATRHTATWMQHSVAAIAAIDSIDRQNDRIDMNLLAYMADGDSSHLKGIKNRQFKVSLQLGILQEHLEELGFGPSVIAEARALLENQGPTQQTDDIQLTSQYITQRLTRLKHQLLEGQQATLATQHRNIARTKNIAVAGLALAVGFLLAIAGYILKTFNAQARAERLVRKAHADLSRISQEKEAENQTLKGLAALDHQTRGGLSEGEIATNAIQSVCQHLNAKIGIIYLRSTVDENVFLCRGTYAATGNIPAKIMKGNGLIGECIASGKQQVMEDIPDNYLTVTSALGGDKPRAIIMQPVRYEDDVLGVMEVGFFRKPDGAVTHFLSRAGGMLAVALKVARTHAALAQLYEETQQQAEELEAQQEELRTTNEELMQKTQLLEASEEELRVQQEELRQANLELEEKARLLKEHNLSIEQARQSIVMKANELEQSGRYKSEFLANMSHELRTPLNSILILAKLLEDNKTGNLLPDQVKYASVIHHAGTDLLNLINNVLDLAKIESGHVELTLESVELSGISQDMLELFNSVAESKSLCFRVTIEEGTPAAIITDEQRLRQVLKNLLSNAFKFTGEGHVELIIGPAGPDTIAFSVTDTGVGIPEEKQTLIFDAFKQADGSTNRKFGGTGLGLSICRELASMLGGTIEVVSEEGKGSTFTFLLPLSPAAQGAPISAAEKESRVNELPPAIARPDQTSSKQLLIIEDDQHFAEILEGYARERGFNTLVAHQGDTGLQLAFEHVPDAIILDIMLPVMDGWTVLKKLRNNPDTKDIPVHLMSATRPAPQEIEKVAVGFLKKPVDKQSLEDTFSQLHKMTNTLLKKVLLIEDHKIQSDHLKKGLIEIGVHVTQAFTSAEVTRLLESGAQFDAFILDINLPDKCGLDLLDEIKSNPRYAETPVIINTATQLDPEMTARIQHHTQTMVVKSDKSNSRVLDEVNLFIHKVKNTRPSARLLHGQDLTEQKELTLDATLEGKRILLADDDMRNVFALSTVFASHNLQVEVACNGREALDMLEKYPEIDLVLMDVMMPEMDGYEAIQKIRSTKRFAKLPIIAVTAKSMLGDRQRVLEAGANDYIAKPVDVNRLLSLIRVWLS